METYIRVTMFLHNLVSSQSYCALVFLSTQSVRFLDKILSVNFITGAVAERQHVMDYTLP